ncbi:MAG: OmpA family protein [Stenotrophobium sp.]
MNKLSLATLGIVLAAYALPSVAQAQQATEMRPYLSVNYDQVFSDRDRKTESSSSGYSFSAGKALNKYWGVEFGGFYDQMKADAGSPNSWRSYGGNLDAMFFYSRNPKFSPYTVLSVGAIRNDLRTAPTATSTDPFGAAGVGFFKFFSIGSQDLGIRADVRYRWAGTRNIATVGGLGEPIVKVGLVLPLGARPAAAEAAVAAAPVAANPDVDSDGDGVPDRLDKCPGTPKGVKVDANGCPIDANRTFEDVHFAFDKSNLSDYGKAIVDNAANVINGLDQKYPNLKVEISGHTDWVGSEGYNQALSERRANAVKKYLSRKGVNPKQIETHAYGETKPIAPNTTAEGRALNRRAEIKTHD